MDPKQPTNSVEDAAPEQEPTQTEQQSGGEPVEDYAGYSSIEEWRQATHASRREGRRLAEQNAQLVAALTKALKQGNTEAQSRTAIDELSELGIPAEALRQTIREVAREIVAEEAAPANSTQAALNSVRMKNPEFVKSEPDFNRWLTANPDIVDTYNKAVSKAPESAEILLNGVFAEYKTTRTTTPAPKGDPAKRVPPSAKIPQSRGGGSAARQPADKLSRDEMKELIKDARRTGSPVELMKALLNGRPIHRDLARRESN